MSWQNLQPEQGMDQPSIDNKKENTAYEPCKMRIDRGKHPNQTTSSYFAKTIDQSKGKSLDNAVTDGKERSGTPLDWSPAVYRYGSVKDLAETPGHDQQDNEPRF
jgi:hypothetical protein